MYWHIKKSKSYHIKIISHQKIKIISKNNLIPKNPSSVEYPKKMFSANGCNSSLMFFLVHYLTLSKNFFSDRRHYLEITQRVWLRRQSQAGRLFYRMFWCFSDFNVVVYKKTRFCFVIIETVLPLKLYVDIAISCS